MWSSKITLVLALTSVAFVRAHFEKVYVQDGKTTELRCPMTLQYCGWYLNEDDARKTLPGYVEISNFFALIIHQTVFQKRDD